MELPLNNIQEVISINEEQYDASDTQSQEWIMKGGSDIDIDEPMLDNIKEETNILEHSTKNNKMAPPVSSSKCKYCGKQFSNKAKCTRHVKSVHKIDEKGEPILDRPLKTVKCALCDKDFSNKTSLYQHLSAIHSLDSKCETSDPSNSKRHDKEIHKNNQNCSAKCKYCGKQFFNKDNCKRHIKNVHKIDENEKPILDRDLPVKCALCDKNLSNKTNLEHHMSAIHSLDSKCETSDPSNLERHDKEIHKNNRNCSAKCKYCGKQFFKKDNCKRHVKNVHKIDENGKPILDRDPPVKCALCDKNLSNKTNLEHHMKVIHLLNSKRYKCPKCEFETSHPSNLRRHDIKIHQNNSSIKYFKCSMCTAKFRKERTLISHQKKGNCLLKRTGPVTSTKRKCPLCPFVSIKKNTSEIYNHFEQIHNIPIRNENYNFNTVEEFYSWKKNIEKATSTSYIKRLSYKDSTCYQCHRSGYVVTKGHSKRRMKITGSCKINAFCPASIKITKKSDFQVTYVQTHVGHENDVKHLRPSTFVMKTSALQLESMVPYEEIDKTIKSSISNSDLLTIYVTNKKDIADVENALNLQDELQKHPFNAISVASWVIHFSQSDNVALIVYKPQGFEDPTLPDLKYDDFLLIFMTKAQKNMLLKHGHDSICIEATHGLNSHEFQMYTLLVLDDTREGFPAAFMFTNRGDECTIAKFFEAIKTVTGCIIPHVFMSDIDETFFSAWKTHMGIPEHRIFCSWHVLEAWRANIVTTIKNKSKREEIQKVLRTLIFELDVETFTILLSETLKSISEDEDFKRFAEYFENYVTNERFKTWAFCYRAHAGVTINVSMENFNRVLKYCYLRGNQVLRLDQTLCAILHLLRDKIFDLLIKLKSGKLVQKLQILRTNHSLSFAIEKEQITKSETSWKVFSAKNNEFYVIKKVKNCNTCQLQCLPCNSCFHEYICSCKSSFINNNMCKHIHAVAISEMKNSDQHIDVNNDLELLEFDYSFEYFEQEEIITEDTNTSLKLDRLKLDLIQDCNNLISHIKSVKNIDQVSFIQNEMKKFQTTIEAMKMLPPS